MLFLPGSIYTFFNFLFRRTTNEYLGHLDCWVCVYGSKQKKKSYITVVTTMYKILRILSVSSLPLKGFRQILFLQNSNVVRLWKQVHFVPHAMPCTANLNTFRLFDCIPHCLYPWVSVLLSVFHTNFHHLSFHLPQALNILFNYKKTTGKPFYFDDVPLKTAFHPLYCFARMNTTTDTIHIHIFKYKKECSVQIYKVRQH